MLKKTQIKNKNAKSGVDYIFEDSQSDASQAAPQAPINSSRIDAVAKKTTKAKLKQKYNSK